MLPLIRLITDRPQKNAHRRILCRRDSKNTKQQVEKKRETHLLVSIFCFSVFLVCTDLYLVFWLLFGRRRNCMEHTSHNSLSAFSLAAIQSSTKNKEELSNIHFLGGAKNQKNPFLCFSFVTNCNVNARTRKTEKERNTNRSINWANRYVWSWNNGLFLW